MKRASLPHYLRITPAQIIAARQRAKLTQRECAELVHLGQAARWGEYETGLRSPDAARWELFLLLTDNHPLLRLMKRRGERE